VSGEENSVPDAWPAPETQVDGALRVPLFPLPNLFLFPGTVMSLHIFEPRYRQMVEDSLDGPGRLVIASVLEEWRDRLEGAPPVHRVAGLGEIARHERLPDGRFVILVAGLARARIQEIDSSHPYRLVEAIPLQEAPIPQTEEGSTRARLREAVLARTEELQDLPEDIPLGHLTDLLLLRLQLPQSSMQDLYSRLAVSERAEMALREHSRRLLPPRKPREDGDG